MGHMEDFYQKNHSNLYDQYDYYTNGIFVTTTGTGYLETEPLVPSLEETIKDILTELLHSEEISSEMMEKLFAFKKAFEIEEEQLKVTRKRLILAEKLLRKKM